MKNKKTKYIENWWNVFFFQVIAVARTADLVLMMLDATKPYVHRQLLEKELESVGIRLNKMKPNIYFKVSKCKSSSKLALAALAVSY